MQYGHLSYLYVALAVVPLLILFYRYTWRKKRRLLEQFAGAGLLARLVPQTGSNRVRNSAMLIVVAIVFMVLALVQPKWGYHWEEVKRQGVDIVVAIDVSKSMLAQDVPPSRLDRAKREVEDLLRLLEGDRIALVGFAGSSFAQCPLTLDYGFARMTLNEIEPDIIPRGGTAIASAILKSIEAFEDTVKQYKAIILITDGEDHTGDVLRAAEEAKKNGIVIYTVGIGNPNEGALIPVVDAEGRHSFLKDKGQVVQTKLDQVMLQKIAQTTGGKSVMAGATGGELEEIYTEGIARMEEKELGSQRIKRYENRFQWPLAVAIALVMLETGAIGQLAQAVLGRLKAVQTRWSEQ